MKNEATLTKEQARALAVALYPEIKEYINAARSGLLFTIREYPLVAEGSLMGRILARDA